jgi:hypothetical protein
VQLQHQLIEQEDQVTIGLGFDLLQDGLALLVRRHRAMERAGLVPDPSAEEIMMMSRRIIDVPTDETLRVTARELLTNHGVAEWTIHAGNCREICADGELERALKYCIAQHVTPPKCPIGFEADYHQRTQERVAKAISDPEWWERRVRERDRIARRQRVD